MNRTVAHIGCLLLALACSPRGPAAETNRLTKAAVTARLDFDAFRIIPERNIFDPNRAAPGSTRTRPREPDRRVRTESFALLGTMSYEKGRFAFFDGSSSDYRKVLQADGRIADFKVAAVAPTCVRLQTTNGHAIELCVGMQMSRREDEDWQVSERTPAPGASASSSDSASAGGESDDVLKRLMQRREQEGTPTQTQASTQEPAAAVAAVPAPPVVEKKPADASSEPDDAVKRLLQKREQELNK
jgi:hypothetical protein